MKKLADPFPSPPGRPGKYVLYISRRGDSSQSCSAVSIWAAKYAAKKYLEALLDEDGVVFETPNVLRSESGIIVENPYVYKDASRGYVLQEVWEHEYSLAEMAWTLPHPYPSQAKLLRRRPAMTLEQYDAAVPVQGPKARSSGVRASRDGMTPIAVLAAEFDLCARDCRAALRKAKVPKPTAGWAWRPDEIDGVRALIAKALGR